MLFVGEACNELIDGASLDDRHAVLIGEDQLIGILVLLIEEGQIVELEGSRSWSRHAQSFDIYRGRATGFLGLDGQQATWTDADDLHRRVPAYEVK